MIHEIVGMDGLPPDAPQCACDSTIVGGPFDHSPTSFMTHMVYADNPDKCWCAPVCLNHIPYSFGFMALEMGAPVWYALVSLTMEPLPTT